MRIGIVDLDTTHPQNWIPMERDLGHQVVGLWDGGAVHPPEYVEKFAKEHKVPKIYSNLEEMVREVDCAVIHSCNWDTHIEKAKLFVDAGKAVLLDKPLAGNPKDLRTLCEWARNGARITGGSVLAFSPATKAWLSKPLDQRGTPHTVLCGCAVDEFNYGIHAYSMLSSIMGDGIESVQHLGHRVQRRIRVNWPDGRIGFIVVGKAEEWLPFYATIVTEKTYAQYCEDQAVILYRALLEEALPYLAGQTDTPPVLMDKLIEPELAGLAARRSWLEGNREVKLSELSTDSEGYDGAAFARGYRKMRYPDSSAQ